MNLLALDTSTDTLFVAVQRGDAVWQYSGPGAQQSSAQLLPAIRQLMQEAQLEFKQLDAIAFGRGPGSFTGLRTACAITQGLAFAAQVPVLPVDSLLTVAEEARHLHGCTEVEAVLDARMNEVYHAPFRFVGGQWVEPKILACAPRSPGGGGRPDRGGQRLQRLPRAAGAHRPACARPAHGHCHAAPGPCAVGKGCAVPAEQALPRYIRDKVAKTTAERESEKPLPHKPPHLKPRNDITQQPCTANR